MRHTPLLLLALLGACSHQTELAEAPAEAANHNLDNLHRHALIIDAHADIEIPGQYSIYVGLDGLSRVSPDKLRAGEVDAVVMTIGTSAIERTDEGYASARRIADAELEAVLELARDPNDDLVLARSPAELLAAQARQQIAFILGFQNAAIFGPSIDGFEEYFSQGVRVFALTHLGHNIYADSSRPRYISSIAKHEPESEHGGLSELGKQAIQRINAMGGVLDVTQLSKKATLQAVELSTTPVIASHSNVRAITDVTRSVSDQEIDLIASRGGVIHVTPFRAYMYDSNNADLDNEIRAIRRQAGLLEDYYYPFELYWEMDDPAAKNKFLTQMSALIGPGSIDLLIDHIDYIVKRVGIDHVGIGSDFNHGGGLEGFQDASDAKNVTSKLVARGYNPEQIGKILGGNFLRVWQQSSRPK